MNEITFSVKPEYAPMAVNAGAMYLLLKEFCAVIWDGVDKNDAGPIDMDHLLLITERAQKILDVISEQELNIRKPLL